MVWRLKLDAGAEKKVNYDRLKQLDNEGIEKGVFMRGRMNPREAKRMMQRMGMNMNVVEEVKEVVIKTTGKQIVITEPEVSVIEMQGQKMFQIAGGQITEKAPERRAARPTIAEEDVRLVADQTGKSPDEARKALEESEGDLAKAILLLQS